MAFGVSVAIANVDHDRPLRDRGRRFEDGDFGHGNTAQLGGAELALGRVLQHGAGPQRKAEKQEAGEQAAAIEGFRFHVRSPCGAASIGGMPAEGR